MSDSKANADLTPQQDSPRSRFPRPGKKTAIVVAVLVGLAVIGVGGVGWATYDYAQRYEGKLLPGTVIGSVDVSGMTRSEAIKAVRRSLKGELDRTITIEFKKQSWKTTPRKLGAHGNAKVIVEDAFAATRSKTFMDKARMRLFDEGVGFESGVAFRYPRKGTEGLVDGIASKLDRDAVDASLDYSTGFVEITPERIGLKVITDKTEKALYRSMRHGETSTVEVATKDVKPEVTADAYDQVLLVRQDERKLYLYDEGEITHSWTIAVGVPEYPTPTGIFSITEKRYMPTWVNPAPDGWGASMPAEIGPGPSNPLGLRALNWSASGIRFHGTENLASLGTPASHGCVRLSNDDVIDLYDMVEVGAPIVSTWG